MPLTLRLAYHSFRAVVRAGILFVCAWLVLIPANANEQAALGAEPGTQYPTGLRPMRTARVIVAIAPDQAYTIIAAVAGKGMSPLMVRIAMIQIASGHVMPQSAQTEPSNKSARDIDGPRFIQVD
jgi:hypothetical protein